MKKLYNIFLIAAALLVFAPFANAQDDWSINGQIKDPYTQETLDFPKDFGLQQPEDLGFAYSKNISKPFKNGYYWIKLESFSTGTATYLESAAPADIVLVLDFSNSMTAQYYTTGTHYVPTLSTQNNQNGNYTYQFLNQNTRYIEYDGEYCAIQIGRTDADFNQGGYAWAYFQTTAGQTYFLNGNEVSTTQPTWSGSGNFGNNSILWTGALFQRYVNQSVSRVNALKEAVADFIDVIYHNDNYDDDGNRRSSPLGNRISIVVFSANNTTDSRQIAGWTDVTKASGAKDETLLRAISAVTDNPRGTYSNRGMTLANTLLSGIEADRKAVSTRTVVMFTDGVPGNYTEWSEQYESTTTANGCIAQANIAKNTHDAKVFTVALYTWPNGNYTTAQRNMRDYLNYTSSNFQNAESLTNYGTGTYDGSYFKLAGNDLSAVFREIAHQSGGSSTVLSASSRNVDVISNSFTLPNEALEDIESSVKIFIAKCKDYKRDEDGNAVTDADGNYVYDFYTEYLKGHTPDSYVYYELNEDGSIINPDAPIKVDANISISLEGNNRITVSGFDYSSMFCGPVYKDLYDPDEHEPEENTDPANIKEFKGYKIIIMIPVKMNPDAVGGPNVPTNGAGSGIYIKADDTEASIPFKTPTISLPVNVHLTKLGLAVGESAKFKIERAKINETETDADNNGVPDRLEGNGVDANSWEYVSTVFVTKTSASTDPLVKVKGMPATTMVGTSQVGFIYKISEEEWAWKFDQMTPPQYTVTSKVDNPFTFTNIKKDNIDFIIRNAESKVTNVFKSGDFNPKYNDSKDNGRTQYNPTTSGSGSGSGSGGGSQ